MKKTKLNEVEFERLSNDEMKTIIGGAVMHGYTAFEPQLTAMAVATDGDGNPEDPKTDPEPDPAGI